MYIVQIHPDISGFNKIKINPLKGEIDMIMIGRGNDLNKE
jgi:hypothetical protein